jgi:hypothetical protein
MHTIVQLTAPFEETDARLRLPKVERSEAMKIIEGL